MTLFKRLFLWAISSLFLIGCAQHPQTLPEDGTYSVVVNGPFQVVWEQLSDYLQHRQIKLKIRKAESGYIDTGFMRVDGALLSRYALSPGSRPNRTQSTGRIKANIYLWKVSDNETLITINTQIEVWENPNKYSEGGWLFAHSSGVFESEIITGINESSNLVER